MASRMACRRCRFHALLSVQHQRRVPVDINALAGSERPEMKSELRPLSLTNWGHSSRTRATMFTQRVMSAVQPV